MSTEMLGVCQNIMSDLQHQYKEVQNAQLNLSLFFYGNIFSVRMQDKIFKKMF